MIRVPHIWIPLREEPCWRWENRHLCSSFGVNQLIGFGAGGAGLTCTVVSGATGTALGSMTGGGGLAAGFDDVLTDAYGAGPSFAAATGGNIGKDWGASNDKTICRYQVWIIAGAKIDGGAGTETITEIDLHGSTDNFVGSNVTIHSPADQTNDSDNQLFDITVTDTTTAYRYHRVDFTHGGGAETHIAELRFWELI